MFPDKGEVDSIGVQHPFFQHGEELPNLAQWKPAPFSLPLVAGHAAGILHALA
jgi:hypothetical protein